MRREVAAAAERLGLEPGERVLDFCCGPGHHLAALLALGCEAAGFDLSPQLIAAAKTRGPAARGDMRAVPYGGGFDALTSFFTSIGYFDDAENEQVFREINRLLVPEGRFLVDYLNPTRVAATLEPASERRVEGTDITENRWIAADRVWKRVRLHRDGSQVGEYIESVRLYPREELEQLFAAAGLEVTGVLGDFAGTPWSPDTPRMILIGHKSRPVAAQTWKGPEPMFRQIPVGGDRNFAYLLADGGEAIAVDPALPEAVLDAAKEMGVKITTIVNTHGHWDHSDGNAELKEHTGAVIVAHENAEIPKDRAVTGGERLPLGATEVEILATPGHTPDSICLHWQGRLVTGDTLFVGKVGGTATEEQARQEYHSLHKVIGALPDETEVWPGHDVGLAPSSTVGHEKRTNPFMVQPDFDAFLDLKNNWAEYKRRHGIK